MGFTVAFNKHTGRKKILGIVLYWFVNWSWSLRDLSMVDTEEADLKYCNGSVKKWFVYLQNRMAAFLKDLLLLMEEVVRLLQKRKQ